MSLTRISRDFTMGIKVNIKWLLSTRLSTWYETSLLCKRKQYYRAFIQCTSEAQSRSLGHTQHKQKVIKKSIASLGNRCLESVLQRSKWKGIQKLVKVNWKNHAVRQTHARRRNPRKPAQIRNARWTLLIAICVWKRSKPGRSQGRKIQTPTKRGKEDVVSLMQLWLVLFHM